MKRILAAAAFMLATIFGLASTPSPVAAASVASAVTNSNIGSTNVVEPVRYRHRHRRHRHRGPRIYFSYGYPGYYGPRRYYGHRHYRPYYYKKRHYRHHRRHHRHYRY